MTPSLTAASGPTPAIPAGQAAVATAAAQKAVRSAAAPASATATPRYRTDFTVDAKDGQLVMSLVDGRTDVVLVQGPSDSVFTALKARWLSYAPGAMVDELA